jgi:hypothetical protein
MVVADWENAGAMKDDAMVKQLTATSNMRFMRVPPDKASEGGSNAAIEQRMVRPQHDAVSRARRTGEHLFCNRIVRYGRADASDAHAGARDAFGSEKMAAMSIIYSPSSDSQLSYQIEADRHGSYTILLQGKVIRRVTALTNYLDKPRWGSRKLEAEAIQDAKCYVESLSAPDPGSAFAQRRFGSGAQPAFRQAAPSLPPAHPG